MSLEFPMQRGNKPASQFDRDISENNLNKLINAKSKDDVTTATAVEAFKNHEGAQIGYGHHIKKYTASVAAYGTTIGAPIVGVLGGTYWALKDVEMPSLNPFKHAYHIGSGLVYNEVIDSSLVSITPRALAGSLTTIGLFNVACGKAFGIAPVTYVANWTLLMISSAVAFAAKQAGDMVGKSYDLVEKESAAIRKDAHKTIVNQLQTTYDNIADGFIIQCEQAKNSPKKMMENLAIAQQMQSQFPLIKSELRKLSLQSSEVDQIMSSLVTAMNAVQKVGFDLRSSDVKGAGKFNAELLSILSMDDLASKLVPREVKKHVNIAERNTLGAMHTVKSYLAAGASGVTNAVVASGAFTAIAGFSAHYFGLDSSSCYNDHSLSNCKYQAAIIGTSLLPGIALGMNVASQVQKLYANERIVADSKKDSNSTEAFIKLVKTYDSIAEHLKKQYRAAKHDSKAMDQLVMDAKSIEAKIPMIEREIGALSVIENASNITEELKAVLAKILNEKETI